MATTTNYSWTTPDDTDLVKDGASAIRTLGSSVDTTVKALSPGTTAGDIDYYTTSTTKARVGIGTANQVLTVNSGATAPEWKTTSILNSVMSPQVSGAIINGKTLNATSLTVTKDRLYYIPMFLTGHSFDRIGFRTAGGWSGTGNVRLGIYNADQSSGKPTTVYLDAGTVSANAGSTNFSITIASTPPTGFYFLAFCLQSTVATGAVNSVTEQPVPFFLPVTATAGNFDATSNTFSWYEAGVTGAFATAGTLVANTSNYPITGLRIV